MYQQRYLLIYSRMRPRLPIVLPLEHPSLPTLRRMALPPLRHPLAQMLVHLRLCSGHLPSLIMPRQLRDRPACILLAHNQYTHSTKVCKDKCLRL